jgi:hypothetical protein
VISGLAEQRLVLHDVIHHLEWFLTRKLFHQIIRSGANSVATILGNARHMLMEARVETHSPQDFSEDFNLHRDIGDFSFPNLRENIRDLQ